MRRAPVLVALIALDLVEAVLFVTYRGACWGYQPGGKINMRVALALAATFVVAASLAIASAVKSKTRMTATVIAATIGAGIIAAAFLAGGFNMFSSMHNQGPEGLVLLLAMNIAIVLVLVAWGREPRTPESAAKGDNS